MRSLPTVSTALHFATSVSKAKMAVFEDNSIPIVKVTGGGSLVDAADHSSQLLADALRKMDGLIGDYRPTSPQGLADDPIVIAMVDSCERLRELMIEWEQRGDGVEGQVIGHPSDCIPSDLKESIVSWLHNNDRVGAPGAADQLQRDKDELLKQVVSLQQQLETSNTDKDKLKTKVSDLEAKRLEKDQQCRSLNDELKATKTALSAKEVELRHLQTQIQANFRSVPLTANAERASRHVTISDDTHLDAGGQPIPRRNSFKKTLVKAFSRKKSRSATLAEPAAGKPIRALNARAASFFSKTSADLGVWFQSIGLDMYSDLAEQNLPSGDRLVAIANSDGNQDLVHIGILSTLHCKKVRLAVGDALSERPGPQSGLDHVWVGSWLRDIGLRQYQRTFEDARIDGRMLDSITLDDLYLLDVTVPFHIIGIRRALQALRMCCYGKEYLQDSCAEKRQGSQKLLHWSNQDVTNWLCSIELDEYVSGLDNTGIHGAVMLLDVQFTSDSLARALGINHTKTLIRKHLSRKFMELIGPTAAQKKVDALQSKSFTPLDPTERPKAQPRRRSGSLGSRKGSKSTSDEVLLCPLDQFPANELATEDALPQSTAPPLSLTTPPSSLNTFIRPPTP